MDIIFGAVQEDKRRADIEAQARGTSFCVVSLSSVPFATRILAVEMEADA